ncbi:MAG: LLM class flavin-dependent oxidoreductase [Pseudomonadota bacterium]
MSEKHHAGPFDIGVTAWPGGSLDAPTLAEQGRVAQSLGFHSYWLPESHFAGRSALPSPLTLLAVVAAHTEDLKLGTTSYLLPIRQALQAAEEVAVLDQLSGGRLILGLGRGMAGDTFHAYGIEARSKRQRFAANLDIMRRAWRGDILDGTEDAVLAPLPHQRPHPPLWVAAFGPLALAQAGGLGLPYLASPMETPTELAHNYKLHAEAVKEAGHASPEDVPIMRTVFACEDRALCHRVGEALADRLPPAFKRDGVSIDDWAILGGANHVAEQLALLREQLGTTLIIGGGRLPALDPAAVYSSLESLARIRESMKQD